MSRITPAELREHMSGCNGTDGWTRVNPFNRHLVVSDGIKWMCEKAGAFWLMDLIALEPAAAPAILMAHRTHGYANALSTTFLRLKVKDSKGATVWIEQDSGVEPIWRKRISGTDFPEGDWTFVMQVTELAGGDGLPATPHVAVMFFEER